MKTEKKTTGLARMGQWVGWRVINYILKSLNRFAAFDRFHASFRSATQSVMSS